MRRSALRRSRRELSNAYLLAKFRFDTAENEPSKVCELHLAGRGRQLRAGLRLPDPSDGTIWKGPLSAVPTKAFLAA